MDLPYQVLKLNKICKELSVNRAISNLLIIKCLISYYLTNIANIVIILFIFCKNKRLLTNTKCIKNKPSGLRRYAQH
jgi:hypothetical protein